MSSLLAELGGRDAIEAVVAGFYERVLADGRVAPFFRNVSMSRMHAYQVDFFCAALGGANPYKGRNMAAAHAALDIGDAEFDAVAGHLVATLDAAGVPEALRDRVLALIAPLRSQIVTRRAARASTA